MLQTRQKISVIGISRIDIIVINRPIHRTNDRVLEPPTEKGTGNGMSHLLGNKPTLALDAHLIEEH
jgi:hypothetical protein